MKVVFTISQPTIQLLRTLDQPTHDNPKNYQNLETFAKTWDAQIPFLSIFGKSELSA
jgi:hypothetical protein